MKSKNQKRREAIERTTRNVAEFLEISKSGGGRWRGLLLEKQDAERKIAKALSTISATQAKLSGGEK